MYAKNLEECLAEKTECLENLEAALTGLLIAQPCMFFNDLISGEIPKPLVKRINEGKRVPVQKYEQAAILVVYGTFKHVFSNSLLWPLIL